MITSLETTPLNGWHKAQGANMANFGGFEMPLWYETGVKNEHLAVLKSAGIFDTSHMACITVKGSNAFDLINFCFTRDISQMENGRCVYGAFLNPNGHCIDDAIVYQFHSESFMICVNAGMGPAIAGHLEANRQNHDVSIEDLSKKVGKMDIQGINSARILSEVIQHPENVFKKMPYFSFKGNFDESALGESAVKLLDGTPVLLSRSGYTGEFGFEIFIDPKHIVALWKDILSAGSAYGIASCGLGARDSLRAGACLPLSHQDIGNWEFLNHPWDFALPYNREKTGFTKRFIGADALTANNSSLFVYPFMGDSLRKVSSGENTQVINGTNKVIGKVLTCATDMGIGWHNGNVLRIGSKDLPQDLKIKGISCGFVMVSKKLVPGTTLTLKDGKRNIHATIVTDIRPDRTARKKIENFI